MEKESNNRPLVSIITPSYNQGEFIEETILSVKNQNYPNIEHIIVDGKSTDNTLSILKMYEDSYNLRWVSEQDNGQSDAGNKGFAMAQGKIIGWLNSDDVYFSKHTISRVVKCFAERPNINVVYGDLALIDEDGLILKIDVAPNFSRARLKRGSFIPHPASFVRNQVVTGDVMDIDLDYLMDLEFFLKASKSHSFYHLNSILAAGRHYPQRKTLSNWEDFLREEKEVLKKHGQKFGFKYKLGRIWDTKITAIYRRFVELKKILMLSPNVDFAFSAKLDSRWARFRRLASFNTDKIIEETVKEA